jgi:hypothetical protein
MFKKIIYNQRIMALALLVLTCIFLLLHILAATGAIAYESLWGVAVTSQASLVKAEGFAIFIVLIFIAGIILQLGLIKKPGPVANGILWAMVIYMGLNVLGYFRCSALGLKIGMSLFCLVLALLAAWVVMLGKRKKAQKQIRGKVSPGKTK